MMLVIVKRIVSGRTLGGLGNAIRKIYTTKPEIVKFIMVDGGIRTHDPKKHGLSTTPFVKELKGY